jgi:hypothetical protein
LLPSQLAFFAMLMNSPGSQLQRILPKNAPKFNRELRSVVADPEKELPLQKENLAGKFFRRGSVFI